MKKHTKLVSCILMLVLSLGILSGCGASEAETATEAVTEEASESDTHIVVDALGREVEVPNNPQKVALPVMVHTNIVYGLQGQLDNVISVAPAAYSGWEISMLKYMAPELEGVDTTMCSDDYTVNVEALVEVGCDLVINISSQTDIAEQLEALGIPCVLVEPAQDMEALKGLISLMADALGCQDRAEQTIAWYEEVEGYFESKQDQIAALSEDEKPRVLGFLRILKTQAYTSGINPYINELQGGQNLILGADVTTPTMEDILAYDPEIIFLSNFNDTNPEDLYNNTIEGQNWEGVSAVENKRVYKVPAGLYRWSPPMTFEKPLYMLWTAQIIQPEIFNDYDMETEITEFYKEFYDYDLTEEQLDEIYRVEANAVSKPIGQ